MPRWRAITPCGRDPRALWRRDHVLFQHPSASSRPLRISHGVDYGVRALVALASSERDRPGVPVTREALATEGGMPPKFLNDILADLRNGGLVKSRRGPDGGWMIARPAAEITVAEVIRVLEGPLASVRGVRPHELPAEGVREPFVSLWIAVRAALRSVLDRVTIDDLAQGSLPDDIARLAGAPGAWDA